MLIDTEDSMGCSIEKGDLPIPVGGDQPAVKTLNDVLMESLQLLIIELLLPEFLSLKLAVLKKVDSLFNKTLVTAHCHHCF